MPLIDADFPPKLRGLFNYDLRYFVAHGGRGAAKSWGFGRAALIQGYDKPLRVLCAREVQKSIRDSVHALLADQIQALDLGQHYQVLQNEIRGVNGTEFLFAGLSNLTIESIKSYEGIDLCWVEEAQSVRKRSWDILIPTIRKPESRIWVSFNPDLDTDDTWTRFVVNTPPRSEVVKINWRDNPWFPEVLEQERQHLKKTDPEAYQNVWEGECKSAVEGAIYRKEIASMHEGKRLRPVPYDPMLKVHTVWDLGWNDATSIILCQRLGSELRVIEYIEDTHTTLAEYVSDLKQRRYNWGTDWLPHDGRAKDVKTGTSAEELLTKLGRSVRIVPSTDIEQGIKVARLVFPRVYFDDAKAMRLIDCLKRYRRRINQATNEPGPPEHDEYSHGADAFRYMALIADKIGNDEVGNRKIVYDKRGIV